MDLKGGIVRTYVEIIKFESLIVLSLFLLFFASSSGRPGTDLAATAGHGRRCGQRVIDGSSSVASEDGTSFHQTLLDWKIFETVVILFFPESNVTGGPPLCLSNTLFSLVSCDLAWFSWKLS